MSGLKATDLEALAHDVRLYVFRHAASTAQVPQPAQIAEALHRPVEEIREALRQLALGKVLILAPNDGNMQPIPSALCPLASGWRQTETLTGESAFGTRWAFLPLWERMP